MTKVQRKQLTKFIKESLPNEEGAFSDLLKFYKDKSKDPVESSVQYIVNSWFRFKANKTVTKIRDEVVLVKHGICKRQDAQAWLTKQARKATNGADHFALLDLAKTVPKQPYVRMNRERSAGNGLPNIAIGAIDEDELKKIWKDMHDMAAKMLKQA